MEILFSPSERSANLTTQIESVMFAFIPQSGHYTVRGHLPKEVRKISSRENFFDANLGVLSMRQKSHNHGVTMAF